MIRRLGKNLGLHKGAADAAAVAIERDGWALLEGVFGPDEIAALTLEVESVFAATPSGQLRSGP